MSTAQDDDPGGFLTRWSRRKVQLRQGGVPDEPARPGPQPAAATPHPVVGQPVPLGSAAVPSTAGGSATSTQAPAPTPAAGLVQPQPRPHPLSPAAPADLPPPPTLADVAALGRDSDFSRFVAPGVQGDVRNAALQKLFTDPHFNIMDGLDTYIDDYGKPDPLPESWLRKLVQSKSLGLFAEEDAAAEAAAAAAARPATATLTDGQIAQAQSPDPDISQDAKPHEDADLRLQPHDATGPASPGAGPEPDAGRQR